MTYGVVAIVKDEAERIERMIECARPLASSFTIIDTGSTDGTQDILRRLGIEPTERPWVNFGVNRSEAFALARGTADWLLALDADMTVEIDPTFTPDPLLDAYMLRMGSEDFEYRLPLLLRGDLPWESRGAVHEFSCLSHRQYISQPTDQVRVTYTDGSSPEKSRWQAELLEAGDQDDPRTVFYLAQTYADLGDKRARATYERRATMDGWDEETFYAKYRAALYQPWPERMPALVAAWEFRPSRLEPLYELVRGLNAQGQHRTALALADRPVVMPSDALFVHTSVYRWGMDFERSIAEWWCGSRAVFADLSEKLLADPRTPEHIRAAVLRNLSC